ncbi:hypothetical protein P7C73_g2593, partial [Tremellales sp. Uapishka_1]
MMYTPSRTNRRPRPPRPRRILGDLSGEQLELKGRQELSRVAASDINDVSLNLDVISPPAEKRQQKKVLAQLGLGKPLELPQPSPPPPYGQDLPSPDAVMQQTPPRPDSEDSTEDRLRARRATDAARSMGLEVDFGLADDEGVDAGSEGELGEAEMRMKLREMRRQLKQRDNELTMAARVADQALRHHEQMIAVLPPQVRAAIPHLIHIHPSSRYSSSGSPGPSRLRESTSSTVLSLGQDTPLFSDNGAMELPLDFIDCPPNSSSDSEDERQYGTVRQGDPQHLRPKLFSLPSSTSITSSPHVARLSILQQAENDDRFMALEQALAEAREGEENQRKAAARLRKEVDKLQREFTKTEERAAAAEAHQLLGIGSTPIHRENWKRKEVVEIRERGTYRGKRTDSTASPCASKLGKDATGTTSGGKIGWGSTTFPEYPPGPASRTKAKESPQPSRWDEEVERSKTTTDGGTAKRPIPLLPQEDEKRSASDSMPGRTLNLPKMRKRVSKSNFLSPAKHAPPPSRPSRSPSPLFGVSPIHPRARSITPSPFRNQTISPSGSPGFASLSSRMASMRQYVGANLGRTLGSELGSEFGDGWQDNVYSLQSLQWQHQEEEREDEEEEEEVSEEESEPPAPIPQTVSMALSSLATALAPSTMFNRNIDSSVPILPRGSLREPGLDYNAFDLLTEAVKLRKIRWVEDDWPTQDDGEPEAAMEQEREGSSGRERPTSVVSATSLSGWGTNPDPWNTQDYPDELSDTSMGLRPRKRPTLALAHRRVSSRNVIPTAKSLKLEITLENNEVITIPGRLVNDLICLLEIVMDHVEWMIIILYRLILDIRYGPKTTL